MISGLDSASLDESLGFRDFTLLLATTSSPTTSYCANMTLSGQPYTCQCAPNQYLDITTTAKIVVRHAIHALDHLQLNVLHAAMDILIMGWTMSPVTHPVQNVMGIVRVNALLVRQAILYS